LDNSLGYNTLSPTSEKITAIYNQIWQDSKHDLAQGLIEPDPVPDATSSRWGVSMIIRPTGDVADVLEAVALRLTEFTGRKQAVYNRESLHTTLRSIESYRFNVPDKDENVHKYLSILKEVVPPYGPIRILYKGLTADKTGVLAQGWPMGDALQNIRSAFYSKLQEYNLLSGPEAHHIRELAHASLVVFSKPLQHPQLLVEFVENNRQTEYGIAIVESVEIVRYKKAEFNIELITLGKVFLGR
jgi:hypothetical protein